MNVLCLTKYPWAGPSSRYRVYQFAPYLRERGIDLHIQTLHDETYLERRFAKRRPSVVYLARRFVMRAFALLDARSYDVVLIQKEMFPGVAPVFERLLRRSRVKMVMDVDDAIHLAYRGRRLDGKVERVMGMCDAVLAGNAWLAEFARRHNSNVALFPTVVDTDRVTPRAAAGPARAAPVVGWIGSPETVAYLEDLLPALGEVARDHPFELRVVGADVPSKYGLTVRCTPWSYEREAEDLRAMDVGVMPLPDDEWSRGKCSLKLLQYMSAGLATVSSATAGAPDIVGEGAAGFIARDASQWRARIAELVADADLRSTMGARARDTVVERFSLNAWGPRLAEFLRAVAEGKSIGDA